MENTQDDQQALVKQAYEYAADLYITQKQSYEVVRSTMIQNGFDPESATNILDDLSSHVNKAKKEKAQRDTLFGALWCIGGTIATVSNIGYIFRSAIIFGAVQFFRGVANLS